LPEICVSKSEIDIDWMAVDPPAIRQACEQNLRIWEIVASVYPTPAATSRQTLNFSSHPTAPQLGIAGAFRAGFWLLDALKIGLITSL
jgi:hypothetical protein